MNPSALSRHALTAAALLATGLLSFAETATTDPVGFFTLPVNGVSGGATEQLNFKALGLTRPVEYQGAAESIGTNTLTDTDAPSGFGITVSASTPYYVEVVSGTGSGTSYDIATISGQTITLAQNLAAGITAPVTFKIRQHWTVAAVFGATNSSGLQGGTASTADQILIYDAVAAAYSTYFYSTGGLPGTGWRKVGGGSADQANTIIGDDDGLIIRRKQSGTVNVVVTGAVKTGQTSTPVSNGLNIIANVYAAGMTLNDCGIYTGNATTGLAQGSSSSADLIQIFNGTGYDSYFYSSGGLPGTGWRKVGGGSTDQSGVSIPAGSSVIVQRKAAGGFNWVIPQHPASI